MHKYSLKRWVSECSTEYAVSYVIEAFSARSSCENRLTSFKLKPSLHRQPIYVSEVTKLKVRNQKPGYRMLFMLV